MPLYVTLFCRQSCNHTVGFLKSDTRNRKITSANHFNVTRTKSKLVLQF